MKNAPQDDAERSAERDDSAGRLASLPPFKIFNLVPVDWGSKRAVFDVEFLDGLVVTGGDLFIASEGAFVRPTGICDRYSGNYKRAAKWEAYLAAAICEAVLARLSADEQPESLKPLMPAARAAAKRKKPSSSDQQAWASDQEERFEGAFDRLPERTQ